VELELISILIEIWVSIDSLPSHPSVTRNALDIHRWGHLVKPVRLTIVDKIPRGSARLLGEKQYMGDEGGPVTSVRKRPLPN
jgi:hypothetical protein